MTEKTMKKTEAHKQEYHPIKKYELLLTKPKEFFKAVEKETDWQSIALFVGSYVLVGGLLEYLAFLPVATESITLEMLKAGFSKIFLNPFITLLISLILAGAIHLGIKMYKKGQPFFPTWKVVAYASLVSIVYSVSLSILTTVTEALNPLAEQSVFSPDPVWGGYYTAMFILMTIVGIIALVQTLYAEILGVQEYHKLERKQAAVAVLVPSLILFLLSIALMIIVGTLMGVATGAL